MTKKSFFDEIKDFNRLADCTEKVEIAISRLECPVGITEEKVQIYQDYLFKNAPLIVPQFVDMNKLQTDQNNTLEVFSRLAYVMARQANPDIGDIDEFLDGFGMFSLYSALPQLADMWTVEMQSTSVPKKKASRRKES